MIAHPLSTVTGAAGLVGRGVYVDLPADPLQLAGPGSIVISGRLADAAHAALRFCALGRLITIVTSEPGPATGLPASLRHDLRACGPVTIRRNTALVWAVGIDYLEAVVLRHLPSGRIIVCNASALFVLSSGEHRR